MSRRGSSLVGWGWVALVSSFLNSCVLGNPKCDLSEERVLSVTRDLDDDEVGSFSPETSEEDCVTLCEEFTREVAKERDYRFDGVTNCSFRAGTLTCSANATEGGCAGGYEEPEMGGAGGVGGAGKR
jgi:hypothetical protein